MESSEIVLMIIMLFSHVFYLCCLDSSALYAWVISSYMESCILKKEYSQGVNMKMMLLNLVLFIYMMFSTTVTSDPCALRAAL